MNARSQAMYLIGALVAATIGATASAQSSSLPFNLKQVGPGVYVAIDGPGHKAGSNAGFVIGDNAVLVVDSFINVDAARALVAQIHQLTPKPIRYLINTHYHLDHTGGGQALRDVGAIIVAHRNVRGWVRVNNINLFGDRITPELKAQIAALPLPDLVTDKDLTIWLGSRKVVVKTVLGHTGGDLAVFVPDARIVFTGDLLWRKIPPNLIDGSVKEWLATDAAFASMPDAARTIYVPGHGDVADLKDVRDFLGYLLGLQKQVSEAQQAGLKGNALISAMTPKLKAAYPDWSISDRAAAAEIGYMEAELAGTKRRPAPQPD